MILNGSTIHAMRGWILWRNVAIIAGVRGCGLVDMVSSYPVFFFLTVYIYILKYFSPIYIYELEKKI